MPSPQTRRPIEPCACRWRRVLRVRGRDSRDGLDGSHSQSVGSLARRIGARMGWEAAQCELLELAGRLHDLGKVAIPDELLEKEGPLAPDERRGGRAASSRRCAQCPPRSAWEPCPTGSSTIMSAGTAPATPHRLAGEAIPRACTDSRRRRRLRRADLRSRLPGAVDRLGSPRRARARSGDAVRPECGCSTQRRARQSGIRLVKLPHSRDQRVLQAHPIKPGSRPSTRLGALMQKIYLPFGPF